MVRRGLALLVAAAALMGNAPQPLRPERAVMVGGHDDLDACLTVSAVSGLNPRGDNFLALRSAPSTGARMLMRLRTGQQVWICDEAAGGWAGVLVPLDDTLDCGVGTPILRRQAYRGRCHAGWVAARHLTVVAG